MSGLKKVEAGDDRSHLKCKHCELKLPKYAWYVNLAQTV